MRPDRQEAINEPATAPRVELAAGVTFQCLVGEHTQARQLTTGQVTFAPEASLPYHRHPFGESITVLRGQVEVEVEGRCYALNAMDNAVIPRGLAHAVRNSSPNEPASLHVAMAAAPADSHAGGSSIRRQPMPRSAHGSPGAERITRFQQAPRYAAGPNTAFLDFFNEELLPGFEMSGGYALFHPGGRLPAHLHDFDESICIIEGTAKCVVEKQTYSLKDGATAFVPRAASTISSTRPMNRWECCGSMRGRGRNGS